MSQKKLFEHYVWDVHPIWQATIYLAFYFNLQHPFINSVREYISDQTNIEQIAFFSPPSYFLSKTVASTPVKYWQ